jgi:hypothetical protein
MKRIANIFLLLIIATTTLSQQTSPSPTLTKQDYLKKSKHQKIAAFCLAGGGAVLWLAGASKYMNQEDNVDGGGEGAMVIGGLAGLASIPFFILSSKNKKKAMSLSFKKETIPLIQKSSFVYRSVPSVNISFRL